MDPTDLDHQLAVGSTPFDAADISTLRSEAGVTAVVSLQSDADLADLKIDIADLRRQCGVLGMTHTRVPIIDFSPPDLLLHLDAGVAAVQGQIAAGRKVYVHCNAGINRSPSVVIAWLVAHRGMTLAAATDQVMERRSCYPYPDIMRAWAEGRGFPLT